MPPPTGSTQEEALPALPGEVMAPPPPPALPSSKPLTKDQTSFSDCGKRALRRYKSSKSLDNGEEMALFIIFLASKKESADFKSWVGRASSPAIDAEVERVATLPVDDFNKLTVEAMRRLDGRNH